MELNYTPTNEVLYPPQTKFGDILVSYSESSKKVWFQISNGKKFFLLCSSNIRNHYYRLLQSLKHLLCNIFISEVLCVTLQRIHVAKLVPTGQHVLTKRCILFLLLLGQCDAVLGHIGLYSLSSLSDLKITMSEV